MTQAFEALDALAIADLVRRGEVSAQEVLETTLSTIAARNPGLNAIVTPLYDEARKAVDAGLPDGPFSGVPFVIKDLVVSLAGVPSTAASRLCINNIPTADSEIVRRHRRAGLVIVGKTNSSEFGLQAVTEPDLNGPTNNPWNLAHSPGGSSGGSAACVAAGLVPMGHATDGGGSIRIPAACCGLFGLKPTRARITAGPEGGEGLAGLAMQHAVTRSVRDSAALLDATAGPMAGDPYFPAPPDQPYLQAAGRDPGRLKIAFSTRAPNGAHIDPQCVQATLAAARLCESLGHDVVEAEPEFDIEAAQSCFLSIFQANTMANIARITGSGLPRDGLIEPLTRAVAERGQAMTASSYIHAVQTMHRESRRIAGFFTRYHLWLTPTLATPAPLTGYFSNGETDVEQWLEKLLAFSPFTFLSNVTGQPAMSVPLGQSSEGLPIGCHFAAPYGEEQLLFSLAGQLERASPWKDKKPRLVLA
ncbi:Aspartyl-tRNA(Asn) amidotransferase subunit A @ Glutamyl-tRNA(Gln) amidotransferase subunit A [hydrothermal vent metagenome]|uniref:Aspartyl-tRNA(Asn) amidotransferase subunit A @ Glutamyl-tRNA(Gln) amidotransferase subunit A n=1 Tax=hydrothermal vent metagenome TaxID=652676 RepID=A0A3B0S2E5_9ZZZZ